MSLSRSLIQVTDALLRTDKRVFDLVVTDEVPCLNDLDGDGAIGGADLTILLGSWGEFGSVADLTGVRSNIDVRLARRGINSLLRTCAVLGGQGCQLELSSEASGADKARLNLSFHTGRASPEDVVSSVDLHEPVKEISLTGRASGYGIVLAVLLLKACNAQVAVEAGEGSLVVITISFDVISRN